MCIGEQDCSKSTCSLEAPGSNQTPIEPLPTLCVDLEEFILILVGGQDGTLGIVIVPHIGQWPDQRILCTPPKRRAGLTRRFGCQAVGKCIDIGSIDCKRTSPVGIDIFNGLHSLVSEANVSTKPGPPCPYLGLHIVKQSQVHGCGIANLDKVFKCKRLAVVGKTIVLVAQVPVVARLGIKFHLVAAIAPGNPNHFGMVLGDASTVALCRFKQGNHLTRNKSRGRRAACPHTLPRGRVTDAGSLSWGWIAIYTN